MIVLFLLILLFLHLFSHAIAHTCVMFAQFPVNGNNPLRFL